MDKNNLVSIIVPLHNAEKFIMDTIKSVIAQTYQHWELIIINDASTDRSVELIEQLSVPSLKLISLPSNHGTAYARNVGIKEANGRYLTFLDADDIWEASKLEKQIEFMKINKCAFSFTGYEFADESGHGLGKVVHVPLKLNYKQALKNTTISTITVMFDMNQISKELLFMPYNATREDTATWWKILKTGIIAYGLNEPLSYYRRYNTSSSANKLRAVIGTWRMYRNIEKLNFFKSLYFFGCYLFNAIRRRL